MKIKKDIYHVIFFICFFEIIIIALATLGFFLGFELVAINLVMYFLTDVAVIILGFIVFVLYVSICKTYYEFNDNSIKIINKGQVIKEIHYEQVNYCEYYSFTALLLGNPRGGKLIVYYLDGHMEKNLEVSFTKTQIKNLYLQNIIMK